MVTASDFATMVALVAEDLEEKGLGFRDVTLKVSTRQTRSRLATAWPGENRITFYPAAHPTLDMAEDTVRHELAHILAYRRAGTAGIGHGPDWKLACKDTGAHPRATNTAEDVTAWMVANERKSWDVE